MATRRQQTRAFKAVKQAQGMAVFPFDWRPPDTEQMIMQDPMQVIEGLKFVFVFERCLTLSVLSASLM